MRVTQTTDARSTSLATGRTQVQPSVIYDASGRARVDLGKLLGEGSFGAVYQGWRLTPQGKRLTPPVAVKVLNPNAGTVDEDVKEELDLMKRIGSYGRRAKRGARAKRCVPHIVCYEDYFNGVVVTTTGRQQLRIILVMELIDGVSMQTWLEEIRASASADSLPSNATLHSLYLQLASALAYIHAAGVSHSDIKPENIMVTKNRRRAVLVDFGVACLKQRCFAWNGSPFFFPPEGVGRAGKGIHHHAQATLAAYDVWALGFTMYALTHGTIPYAEARPTRPCTLLPVFTSNTSLAWALAGSLVCTPANRTTAEDVVAVLQQSGARLRNTYGAPPTSSSRAPPVSKQDIRVVLRQLARTASAPATLWQRPTRNRRLERAITTSRPLRLCLTQRRRGSRRTEHLTVAPDAQGTLRVRGDPRSALVAQVPVEVELAPASVADLDARNAVMVQYSANDDPYGVPGLIFVRTAEGRFLLAGLRREKDPKK